MAEQFVRIRSVKEYFKEFAVEAIGKKKTSPDLVRDQLLDSFRREIFDQLTLKFKDPYILAKDASQIDDDTKEKVNNIISNTVRKWKRLCIEFSKYRETFNVIMPGDLMLTLEDVCKEICDIAEKAKENPEAQ